MQSIVLTPTHANPSTEVQVDTAHLHESFLKNWMQSQPAWQDIAVPHADIYFVSNSSEAPKINQIRAFLQELQYPPHQLHTKLFVIWRLDETSIAAQNALLKSIEEPPAYAQIIATVQSYSKLLPTIQSRVHRVPVEIQEGEETNIARNSKESGEEVNLVEHANPEFWYTQSLADLIQMAQNFKDREQAKSYIEQILHHILNHSDYPTGAMIPMLSNLQEAHLNLQANANVALTMESCFFGLKLGKKTVYKQE